MLISRNSVVPERVQLTAVVAASFLKIPDPKCLFLVAVQILITHATQLVRAWIWIFPTTGIQDKLTDTTPEA